MTSCCHHRRKYIIRNGTECEVELCFWSSICRYIELSNGLRALLISDFSGADGKAGGEDGANQGETDDRDEEEEVEEGEDEGDSGEGSEEDEEEDEEEEQDSDFDELDEDNGGKKKSGSSEKQVGDDFCFDITKSFSRRRRFVVRVCTRRYGRSKWDDSTFNQSVSNK